MDDPRLESWLRATERALAAEPEAFVRALEEAVTERAELQRSLEAAAPAPPSPPLAARLAAAERGLEQRLGEMRARLGATLEDVRRARSAVRGYRPLQPNHPAFISRAI